MLHTNGDVYVGAQKNLVKHGRGQYVHKVSGIKYVGDWKDDMKSGTGELLLPEENVRLTGTFVEDDFTEGAYHDAFGSVFTS